MERKINLQFRLIRWYADFEQAIHNAAKHSWPFR